jgi:ribonuclease Z
MRTSRMILVTMESLDLDGLTLEALSVGGIESCYRIPKLLILLDIGRCPPGCDRYPTLFISHSHIDHCGGLPYYVSMRSLKKMKPPTVYCPSECQKDLQAMLDSWRPLDADAHRCKLIGVDSGDEIPLKHDCFIRAFASPHRVPVRGYTIFKRTRSLKPQLKGLNATQIAARAKAGEEVNQYTVRPEFCFPGDTLIESVEQEDSVRKSRILLLECTFTGSKPSVERARQAGHIHLDQIAERADLFENEIIVLTHWSQRYSHHQIKRDVENKLPKSLLSRIRLILPFSDQ